MKAKLLWVSYFYFTFLFPGYIFPDNSVSGNFMTGNPSEVSTVNPNVRLLPGSINQVQTSVAVHPLNPSICFFFDLRRFTFFVSFLYVIKL